MPVILLIIAALIGTSAVSSTAKPGDGLYLVKLALENVQETVTLDPKARAELQASHALDRLKEVQANIANGNAQGLAVAIANLEEKVKGATDSVKKTGDATLAKSIQGKLSEAETEVDGATKSSVTDSSDDSLLGDAKDLLSLEQARLQALVVPNQAKEVLKNALDKAIQEASDSAKKVEAANKATENKTGSDLRDANETRDAVETHDTLIKQEADNLKAESEDSGSGH